MFFPHQFTLLHAYGIHTFHFTWNFHPRLPPFLPCPRSPIPYPLSPSPPSPLTVSYTPSSLHPLILPPHLPRTLSLSSHFPDALSPPLLSPSTCLAPLYISPGNSSTIRHLLRISQEDPTVQGREQQMEPMKLQCTQESTRAHIHGGGKSTYIKNCKSINDAM